MQTLIKLLFRKSVKDIQGYRFGHRILWIANLNDGYRTILNDDDNLVRSYSLLDLIRMLKTTVFRVLAKD